eukprot:c22687_g1_i1 orf=508-1293(-)
MASLRAACLRFLTRVAVSHHPLALQQPPRLFASPSFLPRPFTLFFSPLLFPQQAAALVSSVRAVSTRSAADSYVLRLLDMEKESQLQHESNQVPVKGSPGSFQLFDTPGSVHVTLRRDLGNEQIEVKCWVEMEDPEGDDEQQEESQERIPCLFMVVDLTKGTEKAALEVRCTYYRDNQDVTVEHVAYLVDGRTKENETTPGPYEAPDFLDLDENLQQAFFDLVKARGITARLATYLMDYLAAKEHREYMQWIQNVQSFIKL